MPCLPMNRSRIMENVYFHRIKWIRKRNILIDRAYLLFNLNVRSCSVFSLLFTFCFSPSTSWYYVSVRKVDVDKTGKKEENERKKENTHRNFSFFLFFNFIYSCSFKNFESRKICFLFLFFGWFVLILLFQFFFSFELFCLVFQYLWCLSLNNMFFYSANETVLIAGRVYFQFLCHCFII